MQTVLRSEILCEVHEQSKNSVDFFYIHHLFMKFDWTSVKKKTNNKGGRGVRGGGCNCQNMPTT
jgi:hypothetical protein